MPLIYWWIIQWISVSTGVGDCIMRRSSRHLGFVMWMILCWLYWSCLRRLFFWQLYYLLSVYRRVLYLDIDCHHGDGVEEAFYHTNRVMTVSFHQYGNGFFPNSGHINAKGTGEGMNYSLNIPLRKGISDEPYLELFQPVMKSVMEIFNPEIIVL